MRQEQEAKLHEIPVSIPRARASLLKPPTVSRPALVRRIEAGLEGRLMLVTAPAGWGKTSVLAEWANQASIPVAWVTCEMDDACPDTLIRAIVAAVGTVREGFGTDLRSMLRSARPLPTPQLIAMLAEAVSEEASPMALVLDDFHHVVDDALLSGMFTLVTSRISNLRVVIGSRTTPPWPLARMRVQGQVTELGPADLAFSEDEVAALMGGDVVDTELMGQIVERSEGWVAGIRLAQLWLAQRGDPAVIVEAFHGSHRDIADYLAEEVVNCLPAEVESFLMATSVTDEFNAPLSHALTGLADASAMLNDVERRGLFLIPMDNERGWYRYHPLFREFLKARLRSRSSGLETELYRRAAEWYEGDGSLVEATRYHIRNGNPDAAAHLLDRIAENLLLHQGETYTLLRLVEQLPEETLQAFPSLHRFYAWGLVLVGRLDEADMFARGFEQRLAEMEIDERAAQRAEIAGMRSRIAAYRADHEATISYARTALDLAEPSNDWFRADALLSLGFALRADGHIDDAADVFGQASMLGRVCAFPHAALWGSRYQALTYVSQGRLRDAEEQLARDIEFAVEVGFDRGAAFAAILVGRGELRYEHNDLDGCRQDLTQALALAQQYGDAKILMNVYVALSVLEEAEGLHDTARATSRRAVRVFDGPGEKANAAWLALRQGDLPAVKRWMVSYVASVGDDPSLSKGEAEQVMLGRALLATSKESRAVAFLTGLLAQAEASGRWGRAVVVRALLARAAGDAGQDDRAFEHVRHILDIAMRERYMRSIVDEGQPVLNVLRRFIRQEGDFDRRRYASRILTAADGHGDEVEAGRVVGLVEPLTARQLDVLRLMIDGRSNREIADELFLAEGTIKAHVHQIYGKLMVRNRAEAIKAAHDLRFFG